MEEGMIDVYMGAWGTVEYLVEGKEACDSLHTTRYWRRRSGCISKYRRPLPSYGEIH